MNALRSVLRFLLKLIIFALTEKWVQFADEKQPRPPKAAKPRGARPPGPRSQRKVFDPAAGRQQGKRRSRTHEPLLEGEGDRFDAQRSRAPARADMPRPRPALPGRGSASLAGMVRDPREIRQAMIVSAAFSTPPGRRLLRRPR